MRLFDAHMKDGSCITGENWDLVDGTAVRVLVVHHPWIPGVSIAVSGEATELFLVKEGLAAAGKQGSLVKVMFGKRMGSESVEIHFLKGGGIVTPSV